MPVIPVLGGLGLDDCCKFGASWGYIVSSRIAWDAECETASKQSNYKHTYIHTCNKICTRIIPKLEYIKKLLAQY